MADVDENLVVSEDGDVSLPLMEVVTGRGFVTGKSGSGKSNTASVVAEELLDRNVPLLVVDTDGEYYGLKQEYELLHVGADDDCDVAVGPGHAEAIATIALDEHVPVILDVSGYLDAETAHALVEGVTKHLFAMEKQRQTPFLLLVEEVHEFIPEQGGLDDLGEMLIRVAKRGRKRGLGLCGLSQRPAAVDKDFITQCDWLVWHRLTWENDTRVVGKILGQDAADDVQDLGDGEAFLMTDWDGRTRRVQFRRKRTFDAGATPGMEDFERPELETVDDDLVERLAAVSAGESLEPTDGEEAKGEEPDGDGGADADADAETALADRDDDGTAGSDADRVDALLADPGATVDASPDSDADTSRGPPDSPQAVLWEFGRLVVFLARAGAMALARALDALGDRTYRAVRAVRRSGPVVEVVGTDEYGRDTRSGAMYAGPVLDPGPTPEVRPARPRFVALGALVVALVGLVVWAVAAVA